MYPDDDSKPGHSTGPRTPAGKAVSAMNHLTHGCRSEKIILRHEDPAEYTAVIQGWFQQYNPHSPAERLLVNETAHAQWLLLRNQRRFDDVEYEKNMNFRNWTEEQHHEYALALRYKTAAERTFLRWFKELESYYARVQRKQERETSSRQTSESKPPEIKPAPTVYPIPKSAQPEPCLLETVSPPIDGEPPVYPTPDDKPGG
ncbi:MAG TPA: hypothetical protein VK604_19360 [Bryobacteraceae bacterium]|nr:hypothetical protein [Bryobacteraceae bacterium]